LTIKNNLSLCSYQRTKFISLLILII